MSIAIKGGKVQLTSQIQCRCQYGQARHKSCTTSTDTVTNGSYSISAMIDWLRSRWGLPVIRLERHRRYRFRPWLTQAELEDEGQYRGLMPRLYLDDPMAYRKIIQMPPELYQEGQDLDERSCESRSEVGSNPQTSRHWWQLVITLQYAFRVASPTIEKFVPEVCDAITRAY